MKKLMFLATLCVTLLTFGLTSCQTQSFGVLYNVTLTGDGDGLVDVTFPNGTFQMNGDADLAFQYCNDTTTSFTVTEVLTAEEIESTGTKKEKEALANVNNWVDANFSASAASGTYDVQVKGYVKETLTGLTISVDRRFTNRTDTVQ